MKSVESNSQSPTPELRLQDTFRLSAEGVAKVLGDLEARVMHVVWALEAPASSRTIHERVVDDHRVAIHTVITVLNKLVMKGLLCRKKLGDVYHYRACITETEFRQEMSRRAVEGILSLGPQAVAASFVDLLLVVGLAYAVWDRARAWRTQRVVLCDLQASVPRAGSEIARAAASLELPLDAVRVVEGLLSPAFTLGWLRPRIYVSACLPERLSPAELRAVLAHEAAHVRRRDPLRLCLLRFLACTLFWLPAVRRLAEDIADEAEVSADDAAVLDQPLALASAIVTLAQWLRPGRAVHDGVGFDERNLLERRVRRLAGEDVAPRSRLTRTSVVGAALALLLAWTSGAVMAHPLPGQTPAHDEHCQHEGASVLFHLFCLSHGTAGGRSDCLHR
jgi:predicted transcriptional regulator